MGFQAADDSPNQSSLWQTLVYTSSSCHDRLFFQWHLVKCRKSHPGSDHVICPFNASHHVTRQEQEFHLTSCPDRKMVEVER